MELFFGRQKEVQKIIEQINTPGQHSILYGERGVGKSSLANISTELLISKLITGKLYTKRCDSQDNFLSILAEPLSDFGVEINLDTISNAHKQGGKAGIKIPIAEAGVSSERITTKTYMTQSLTPSTVSAILQDKHGLLYIDEIDRIKEIEDKYAIAELIKLLSDNGSNFKILVVGVAETAEELTGGHPSVQRCLKEKPLRGLTNDELKQIVTGGANKIGIKFDDPVVTLISKLSSGYAHFTHLLALKCAEEAIAKSIKVVDRACLSGAIKLAVEDAEGSLKRAYFEASRSYGTDMYKTVLISAAKLNKIEFTADQLRQNVEKTSGQSITQGALNNYLKRLVADDGSCILKRMAKGVYKFCDPRMPSYIKISNAELT
jgi:Cdc6-like AAA superfamily ATPase